MFYADIHIIETNAQPDGELQIRQLVEKLNKLGCVDGVDYDVLYRGRYDEIGVRIYNAKTLRCVSAYL